MNSCKQDTALLQVCLSQADPKDLVMLRDAVHRALRAAQGLPLQDASSQLNKVCRRLLEVSVHACPSLVQPDGWSQWNWTRLRPACC